MDPTGKPGDVGATSNVLDDGTHQSWAQLRDGHRNRRSLTAPAPTRARRRLPNDTHVSPRPPRTPSVLGSTLGLPHPGASPPQPPGLPTPLRRSTATSHVAQSRLLPSPRERRRGSPASFWSYCLPRPPPPPSRAQPTRPHHARASPRAPLSLAGAAGGGVATAAAILLRGASVVPPPYLCGAAS